MNERTALGEQILRHWRAHCPEIVRELESMKRLDEAVFETQERTGDVMYELMTEQELDYQTAWELTREEWAFPTTVPEPSSKAPLSSGSRTSPKRTRPQKSRRATSGSRSRTGSGKAD